MRFGAKHESVADHAANDGKSDPELDRLIEVAESGQLPELIGGADATHTVLGAGGAQARFEGQGTPEGDEILLQSLRGAIKMIDEKRERESQQPSL